MLNKSGEYENYGLSDAEPERIMATQKEVQDIRSEMEDKLTGFRFEALQILTPNSGSGWMPIGQGAARSHATAQHETTGMTPPVWDRPAWATGTSRPGDE